MQKAARKNHDLQHGKEVSVDLPQEDETLIANVSVHSKPHTHATIDNLTYFARPRDRGVYTIILIIAPVFNGSDLQRFKIDDFQRDSPSVFFDTQSYNMLMASTLKHIFDGVADGLTQQRDRRKAG